MARARLAAVYAAAVWPSGAAFGGRLISIIGSALRNSNLDLVTSAELNQRARQQRRRRRGITQRCGSAGEILRTGEEGHPQIL